MAILPMQRITILSMKRERKKILELLQRRGCVEISDVPAQGGVFEKTDTSATRALLDKNAQTAQKALEVLDKYSPAKKGMLAFLEGREAVSLDVADKFYSVNDKVVREAQRIVAYERDIAEARAEAKRYEGQLAALTPWLTLPVPQTFRGTKKTAVYIGSVDGEQTLEQILGRMAEAVPELEAVHLEIVSTSKSLTCFYMIVLKADALKAEEALRAVGFTRPAGPTHRLVPEKKQRLEARIEAAHKKAAEAEEKIAAMAGRREDITFLWDHLEMRSEKYAAIERLAQTNHVFILEGYVPQRNAAALRLELEDKFECAVEIADVPETEEAPVLLQNSWFTEPTESVLEAYSMPGKGELDPIPVMSIFYYIMFGLMFSDAAYGLIIAGVCGFCLLKFKNMEPNWSRNLRMFFWCGVSTMFWGVMFSSYFGDVVTSVAETFFGRSVTIPALWFTPLDDPMKLLIFCLAVGIIHLTAGYVMKAITCIRNGDYLGVVWDAVLPTLFLYPLVLMFMGTEIFENLAGFMLALPPIVSTVCLAIVGLCALGIIFTGGRESKNWGKRILKGLYALYNIGSGWLSDILSYSRLLALGLATGVIASVMNQLAAIAGGGAPFVVGLLIYFLVFLVGHALNFGINVLGAYVHSNRLEYVEFFGKFFDGGGRKFEPLAVKTKHYKIIEEDSQNV